MLPARVLSRSLGAAKRCGRAAVTVVSSWRSLSTGIAHRNAGLLREASDVYYSPKLDLNEAKKLLDTPGVLWEAAKADVVEGSSHESVDAYLQHVDRMSEGFMHRSELYGRDAIMMELRKIFQAKGRLVMELGSTSVGKTFLIKKLEAEMMCELHAAREEKIKLRAQAMEKCRAAATLRDDGKLQDAKKLEEVASTLEVAAAAIRPRRMVYYNARHHGADLVSGLLKVFHSEAPSWKKYMIQGADLAAAAVSSLGTDANAVSKALHGLAGSNKLEDVLEDMVKACEEEETLLCLVIDECNAALAAASEEDRRRIMTVLRLFIEYTKETLRMNVLLLASEYAEPYRLSAVGFKSNHFSRVVMVPEMPPKEMRALLKDKWGMGDNLAEAFLAVWGGHVLAARTGVEVLKAAKECFRAVDNPIAFSNDAKRGAVYCIDAEVDMKLEGMRNLLAQLATQGHAPFRKETDERVRLICERNVGGVVISGAIAPGIPPVAWAGSHDSIVVATTEAMRMLLARQL